MADVSNLQLKQVAAPRLAVDAKVEQRQFPRSAKDLKADPDSPNFFEFERRLLTDKFVLVPRSGLTHPLIQAGPKVCVKTLF